MIDSERINLPERPDKTFNVKKTFGQMATPQVSGVASRGYPSGKTTGQLARDLLVEQGQGTDTSLSGIRVNDVRDSLGGVGTRFEGRMPDSIRGGQ